MRKKIYFRADGNSEIGLGHLIRSLSLAEMLNDKFDCHFLVRNPPSAIKEQILQVCSSVIALDDHVDLRNEVTLLIQDVISKNDIVVLDGYHFDTAYQKVIKQHGAKLVCIDDIYACHYVADVIINHAAGISKEEYSAEPYTMFYLGLAYSLVRKPFREGARKQVKREKENQIFICFGGADPNNTTLEVLKKLCDTPSRFKFLIIIGAANVYREEVKSFLEQKKADYQLLCNLNAEEMFKVMEQCSMAITSPSSVSYEYLSVGGELYLKIIADNQKRIYEYFVGQKLAFDFSCFPITSKNKYEANLVLENQADIFDGRQKERFSTIFQSL